MARFEGIPVQGAAPRFGGNQVTPPQPSPAPMTEMENSEFPQEWGESRAAQELPELGFDVGLKDMLPEDLPLHNKLGIATSLMTSTDPQEMAQILSQFPNVGIQYAPDGTMIVANNDTGQKTVLNRPGVSARDVMQILGLGAAFTPAGRAGTGAASITGGALRIGGASAATEGVLQGQQALSGGTFDTGDVALSGALGAGGEYLRPLVQMGLKGRELFKSLGKIIPEKVADALAYAESTGKDVTTSDVLSETMTPARRIFLKMAERTPFTGTGKQKVGQQIARLDTLEEIADEYDINVETEYGQAVFDSFTKNRQKQLDQADAARTLAKEKLNPIGQVPTNNARRKINDLLDKSWDTKPSERKVMDNALEEIAKDLEASPRNFERLIKYRSSLYKGVNFNDPYADGINAAYKKIGDAMSKDMQEFASQHSDEALRAWNKSNKIYRDELSNVKNTQLAKLIQSGNIDEEVIDRVIRGGNRGILKNLHGRLDKDGKAAARQFILSDALRKAGWSAEQPRAADVNSFVKALETPNARKAMKVFFKESDLNALDGIKTYLDLTKEAQKAAQGAGMTAAVAQGNPIFSVTKILLGALSPVGAAGQVYESRTVRNLLLRLHNAKGDKAKADAIMEKLVPLLVAANREQEGSVVEMPDMEEVDQTSSNLLEQLKAQAGEINAFSQ